MKSILRYILSVCNYRHRRLNKLKHKGDRHYAHALFQYLHTEGNRYGIAEKYRIVINARTHDIGELLKSTKELLDCVSAKDDRRYYTNLPVWFFRDTVEINLLGYATDAGYFVNVSESIATLHTLLSEITHEMNTIADTDMIPYYDKKARRLYQELISVGTALL